jgi:uncharacterized membrane protein YfcA
MDIVIYGLVGAGVGFLVGLTGIGGGAVMTPVLIGAGVPVSTAVGTDLLYAAITKTSAFASHARQKTVSFTTAGWLAAGSIPAALVTLWFLGQRTEASSEVMRGALGVMLLVTAGLLLSTRGSGRSTLFTLSGGGNAALLATLGALVGLAVTLSSVGAGAIISMVLLLTQARLLPVQVVGTDIAHAIPLTLVAGLGHFSLGHVDLTLLGMLIIGSLPASWLGARYSKRLAGPWLKRVLAVVLLLVGVRLLVGS